MSILINKNTKVMTQGITGKTGQFHTRMCREYANGQNCFVAGVNPKKAGEDFEGVPIFGTVADAKKQTGANASVIYVPRYLGSSRSRPRFGHLHYRGYSSARHDRGSRENA